MKKLLAAIILLSFLLDAFVPIASAASFSQTFHMKTKSMAMSSPKNDLLQFTSANHALAFKEDGIIVASLHHMLRVRFLNARPSTPHSDRIAPKDSASLGASPFLGHVTYRNVWDGVTVIYEADPGSVIKSTYYIDTSDKEKDPVGRIRLGYNRPVAIDENGDLRVVYRDGIMTEHAPIAWQETEHGKKFVSVSYVIRGNGEVGFALGEYLPGVPLVIDPLLAWNTFLGGSGTDNGGGVAVDTSGNVYITGDSTATWGSPVTAYSAGTDAYAAKLDTNGNLTWSTFLGGSGTDNGKQIAVDTNGNVYVSGNSTATWGSPVRAYTSGTDAFAAKLNSSGSLTWSTFLGAAGTDNGNGVAVDSNGNVYVGGVSAATWGTPVRAYTSGVDTFAAKLDSSGNLTWNTFLGGSGSDNGRAVAVDASGNVYVGGNSNATWGTPVRAYTSSTNNFAAKLDSSGNLTWNTFLDVGLNNTLASNTIAVDSNGNVYMTGNSSATWGSPVRAFTTNGDAVAVKLDSNGNLTWNTFLGGTSINDDGRGIAVDSSGNVYVQGTSSVTWGSPVRAFSSSNDAFVAKLDSGGGLTWMTFQGGSGSDISRGIALDTSGNIYVGGHSTATWGSPVTAYSAGTDSFVAKIFGVDAATRLMRLISGFKIKIFGGRILINKK